MIRILVALFVILSGVHSAEAQRGAGPGGQQQESGAEKVLVGAGTTNGTTTGASGPQDKGGSGPTEPSASLCDDFKGEVRQACLGVVLGAASPSEGAPI